MGSAYMLLGGVAFLQIQHDAAIELCQKAVRLAHSDYWAVAFLGLVYNYSGDAQGALAAFKEAMRLSPHPPAWYTYGLRSPISLPAI
jgi:tetratricopeptide (TPR) repeat protein